MRSTSGLDLLGGADEDWPVAVTNLLPSPPVGKVGPRNLHNLGSGQGPGVDYVVDRSGRLAAVRVGKNLSIHTSRPAKFCDGGDLPGYLVVEYEPAGAGCSIRARSSTPLEPGPLLEQLSGIRASKDFGPSDDGHSRALRAEWRIEARSVEVRRQDGVSRFTSPELKTGPATITLEVDIDTLHPARWLTQVAFASGPSQAIVVPYIFAFDIAPVVVPDGVAPPACVTPT